MRLSEWAKQQGIHYYTALRWFHAGQIPAPAYQNKTTGTIIVNPPPDPGEQGVALYARVSSSDQRGDLSRQLARLTKYAAKEGLRVIEAVEEIGSALNGHRPKLLRILRNPKIGVVVVEHRDRLARFGSDYVDAAMTAAGRRLVVVDATEMKNDLVQDMVDVLTSFCARLYGKRAAKNRAMRAVEATK